VPNWHEILDELRVSGSTYDMLRRKYISNLQRLTNRNIIVYYSGWLQKPEIRDCLLNDADKNGFMTVVHKLDRNKGLDLILHTPGGESAATESLVDYLRSMFGKNIRAIIPQLAMSAGTMVACSAKEIIMGKQSSLGPIDPQFRGVPAHGVVEEFKRAYEEISANRDKIAIWQPIIAKYNPTLIGECEKAIEWSNEMVKDWLLNGMLSDKDNANDIADNIIKELGDHALNKSHARHLSMERCREIGLEIVEMESDPELQDAILSVHHICIQTLSATNAYKIIENHKGIAFIQSMNHLIMQKPR
jgi:ATP-dependent protease ClpP protease subunit